MRYAAWVRVIVPSPARGEVDLQTNRPAEISSFHRLRQVMTSSLDDMLPH